MLNEFRILCNVLRCINFKRKFKDEMESECN